MNPSQIQERVAYLKDLILQESENKSEEIQEEGHAQANERRNKMFGVLREKLISDFAKKEEEQETDTKTQRSRRINNSRLEVQEERQ